MKKFTHSLRALVALVLCLVGASAMAIDISSIIVDGTRVNVAGTVTVDVEVTEGTAYSPGDVEIEFGLDQVLSILGISDITAADQYIVNVTTTEAVTNTTDGWRDSNGDAASWGTDGGVCVKIQDPSSGFVDYIGCYDTAWEAGDEYDALWGFVAEGKAAIVDVHISFVSPPRYDLDAITVVNEGAYPEVVMERYATQGETTYTVSLDGAWTALGITEEEMQEMIWAETTLFVAYNNDMGVKVDAIQVLGTTDGWLKRTCRDNGDGTAGDILDECCASDYSSLGGDYYIYWLDYDEETHEMSFIVGHDGEEIGAIDYGTELYTYLYLMNAETDATKAYVIKDIFKVIEPPYGSSPSALTMVGSQDITVEVYQSDSNYGDVKFYPNIEEAISLLGCSEGDITLLALAATDRFATSSTANYGGWWFNESGYVASWGSAPVYIQPQEYGEYSTLVAGQMPGVAVAGTVYQIPLYIVYETSYYMLNVSISIIERPDVDLGDCENVWTTTVSITQEVDNDYTWSDGVGISYDVIEGWIGTTSFLFYGKNADGEFTDEYSVSPESPGFWMGYDGTNSYADVWGSAPWGVTIYFSTDTDCVFNCIQMPGYTADGDVYTAPFYLVNLEEAKMITVILVYTIGDVVSYESAGSMDVTLPLPTEAGDEIDFAFRDELEEICEDLEVEMGYFADLVTIRGTVGYTTANTVSTGVYYDTNGYAVEPPGDFFFCFDGYNLLIGANENLDIDNPISTQAVLQCESTQLSYTLNLTFVNEDDYTAVKSVIADEVQSGAIYDLSGRQVSKAVKGVYIQNGKKILVK